MATVVFFKADGARILKGADPLEYKGNPNALIDPDLTSVAGVPPHLWCIVNGKLASKVNPVTKKLRRMAAQNTARAAQVLNEAKQEVAEVKNEVVEKVKESEKNVKSELIKVGSEIKSEAVKFDRSAWKKALALAPLAVGIIYLIAKLWH